MRNVITVTFVARIDVTDCLLPPVGFILFLLVLLEDFIFEDIIEFYSKRMKK